MIDTLAGRLGVAALLTNAVLLPVLYLGLDAIVTRSEQDAHVTEMRTYARLVADQFELGEATYTDDQIRAVLENVLISGDAVFAELHTGQRVVRAELGPAGSAGQFVGDDFAFEAGGDETYHLSVPVRQGPEIGTLRFGFDERNVMNEIRRTRALILQSLGAFFLASALIAIYSGVVLAKPLGELQRASRRVASGELTVTLHARSRISEFRRLGDDLEVMRSKLVSVGQRLQQEIRERDVAENQRRRLEERLSARRRLETIGTLAGGIAHEFNNILVPIQLYTELALESADNDSETRHDLMRVLESARRAKRIVNDIRVFTREPHPGAPAGIDAAVIVTEVAALYERLAPPGVSVVQEIRRDCAPVRGDAAMLYQAVLNLCENASQAMTEQGGTLTVTVEPADEARVALADLAPGSYVDICVRDTGHGIDDSIRSRIFEPFFTTRTVGHGTGLGLFVVHGMMTSMGGGVNVESEPGVGTEFHLLLPVLQAPGADDFDDSAGEEGTT